VATWPVFSQVQPELARAGNALFYQHGVGLAFIATLRADGAPRLHPVCPLSSDEGLFAFIIPSPKQADLRRDGVYAMHSFPRPDNEDAFYIAGRANLVTKPNIREALAEQFVRERSQFPVMPPSRDDALFEFDLDSCLLTRTTGHGDPKPHHTVWREAEYRRGRTNTSFARGQATVDRIAKSATHDPTPRHTI
jgi:hypothetical protein